MSNKQSTPSNRPAGRGRGGKGRGRGAGNSSGNHVNQWTQGDPSTRAWGKPGQGRGGNQGNATGSQGNQWMQGDAGKRAWDKPGEQARKKKAAAEQAKPTKPAPTAEERFREASSQIHDSVQRHMDQGDLEMEESSSEDEMDDTEILQSTFRMYTNQYGDNSTELEKTSQYLVESCRSGANVCLVCIGKVKRLDAIWTCSKCYCVLHLPCVQKWAKEGALQMQNDDTSTKKSSVWSCPKCRYEQPIFAIPKRYSCFCAKVIDPPFHPWLSPHTCGQTCERPLRPECGHKCLLLCHPGPCPPCPKMVRSACHCQRQQPQPRRCSSKTWSCGQTCGKVLSCGQHSCQQPCHEGVCKPCLRTSKQPCHCGKLRSVRPCATPQWQCDSVCNKQLSCGHHRCEVVCHSGLCGDCPRSGKRFCPCGKTSFQIPCTENIPTCGDTCDKLLECGLHKCTRRCHSGPCETCRQLSVKKCRCGQREKSILCCKEYLCDTKCQQMKDCQRHQCKRKCCDGSCPACEQLCNRPLPCKNHRCPSQCHTGLCYPCQETIDVKCFCESTCNTVPCGREKFTKPPRCNQPCKIPPNCHHAARDRHRCHFNRCQPCQQACDKPLPQCSHRCPWQCHTAVLIKQVENKGARAAPWEPKPQAHLTLVDKPCPPCQVPIPTMCVGKHEMQDVPCALIGPFSCKKQCGRMLACTNHHCTLECHLVTGAADDSMFGKECEPCDKECSKPRPKGCVHSCIRPCHTGSCPACKKSIRQRCHCKIMMLHIDCRQWTSANDDEKADLVSCKGPCTKQLPCSHLCNKSCHPGDCSKSEDCIHKVSIRCSCRRRKKDFPCKDVREGNAKVKCDTSCKQAMEKQEQRKEEEKLKKEEEDKAQQQRDQDEYERLMNAKGKKRRGRRKTDEVVELRFWQEKKFQIILLSAAIVLAALSYVIFFA
ncbi:NF-X1-type zinc finger protein NFXL1-like [Asterias amurensis]|uniref:NF-X1-type zinc finger protein NFXL1-like n=1 Tax=Asterias amurensis TaxID=7602 RepID=UPI003AB829CA